MDFTIRVAKEIDAALFYDISRRAHTASYYDKLVPAEFKDEFDAYYRRSKEREAAFTTNMISKIVHPEWRVAVAEYDGKIAGYTLAHSKVKGKLMLRGLFVDPAYHSKGIGSALFKTSLAWAKPGDIIELTVVEANQVARSLYERHDFVIVGDRSEDFFGAKMVVMQRPSH